MLLFFSDFLLSNAHQLFTSLVSFNSDVDTLFIRLHIHINDSNDYRNSLAQSLKTAKQLAWFSPNSTYQYSERSLIKTLV